MYSHDRCRDQKDAILYGKNIVKTFLILALPIMFSSIIKTLHDMVDICTSWPILKTQSYRGCTGGGYILYDPDYLGCSRVGDGA